LNKDKLIEALAAQIHESWSEWMKYMDSLACLDEWGAPNCREHVRRWRRQIDTAYADLSEEEKESDRVEARKYLEVLLATIVSLLEDVPRD
jgi:hypothetical protein